MTGELEGKVALVTGASTGIGYAIAQSFGRAGASVVVNYVGHVREAEALASELSKHGSRSIAVKADVSKSDEVRAMVEQAVKAFKTIDILVNNAGVEKSHPFLELPEEAWDRVLGIDLKGAFLCSQHAGRVMRDHGGGSIVNISSIHEDATFPGFTDYCAAKGGMRMMMRNMALELAEFKIRVNNVAPGAIATPINRATLSDPKKVKAVKEIVPLQRFGEPEDVANVVLFLASDRASYVTGSTYYVDGGFVRHAPAL